MGSSLRLPCSSSNTDLPRESGLSVETGVNRPVYVESWGSVLVKRLYVRAGSPCKLVRSVYALVECRSRLHVCLCQE